PVIAHGVAWWHGAESNYWGHNAMIRTRAFAACAGLPALEGREPFGGNMLSHDFVEAALMRRGGWALHMEPGLGGSYEAGPPPLVPGQPAALAGAARARPASGQPAAPDDGHRPLLHRADVGDADAGRPVDPAAGGHRRRVCAAGLLAQRRSRTLPVGVRPDHGPAVRTQAVGRAGGDARWQLAPRLWRQPAAGDGGTAGDRACRADGAGDDVPAVARRGRGAGRQGLGLG